MVRRRVDDFSTSIFVPIGTHDCAFITNGGTVSGEAGGVVLFLENATVFRGHFTNRGGQVEGSSGGLTQFRGSARAVDCTLTNSGGKSFGPLAVNPKGGATQFFDNSNAGASYIIADGGDQQFSIGGSTEFYDNANAGSALLITNGGLDTQSESAVTSSRFFQRG